jgi:3-oxoacyl-[acyl-carrier protein] reductase
MMDILLKGKVAVIADVCNGLGRAVAKSLAKEGVNLAICARNNVQLQIAAKEIVDNYNVDVLPVVCDVTNNDDIVNFQKSVIKFFGTCHILLTNFDDQSPSRLQDFKGRDFQKTFELNLISTIYLVNAFLPFMQDQKWGRIIASTSSNIKQLLSQFPLSNVSEVGVVTYIRTFAKEFAKFNITANVLAVGLSLTDPKSIDIEKPAGLEKITLNGKADKVTSTIPVNRIDNQMSIETLTAFIASENASFITGETFLIDEKVNCNVIC